MIVDFAGEKGAGRKLEPGRGHGGGAAGGTEAQRFRGEGCIAAARCVALARLSPCTLIAELSSQLT